MYRLLKSKCFHCHRLRVHDSKLNIFQSALKLIKAGEMIGSQRIKHHFASLAHQVLVGVSREKDITEKTLDKIKRVLTTIMGKREGVDEDDLREQFKFFNRTVNMQREKFEN